MAYIDVDKDIRYYTDPLEEKIDDLQIDTGDLEKRIYELEQENIYLQSKIGRFAFKKEEED